jgi:hypothetical protein
MVAAEPLERDDLAGSQRCDHLQERVGHFERPASGIQ